MDDTSNNCYQNTSLLVPEQDVVNTNTRINNMVEYTKKSVERKKKNVEKKKNAKVEGRSEGERREFEDH